MQIEALCREAGVELTFVPFLLGPTFALQGWNDSPFNLNERRGAYMWRDLERLTAKHGLSWQRPSHFPRNATVPLRVAAAFAGEPWCADFIRRVFVANFGEDREIGNRDVVVEILNETLLSRRRPERHRVTLSLSKGLRHARRPTISSTSLNPLPGAARFAPAPNAIELGTFGAPNCIVDGEHFWGEETLADAIAWAQRSVETSNSEYAGHLLAGISWTRANGRSRGKHGIYFRQGLGSSETRVPRSGRDRSIKSGRCRPYLRR